VGCMVLQGRRNNSHFFIVRKRMDQDHTCELYAYTYECTTRSIERATCTTRRYHVVRTRRDRRQIPSS
jgi:hypothetical protein